MEKNYRIRVDSYHEYTRFIPERKRRFLFWYWWSKIKVPTVNYVRTGYESSSPCVGIASHECTNRICAQRIINKHQQGFYKGSYRSWEIHEMYDGNLMLRYYRVKKYNNRAETRLGYVAVDHGECTLEEVKEEIDKEMLKYTHYI